MVIVFVFFSGFSKATNPTETHYVASENVFNIRIDDCLIYIPCAKFSDDICVFVSILKSNNEFHTHIELPSCWCLFSASSTF